MKRLLCSTTALVGVGVMAGQASAEDVMALTRDAGFGPEAKRRIMLVGWDFDARIDCLRAP